MKVLKNVVLSVLISFMILVLFSCDLGNISQSEFISRKTEPILPITWYNGDAIENGIIGEFTEVDGTFGYQSYVYGLWAGKNRYAGKTVIWNDLNSLFITIDTNDSADLQSIHIDTYTNSSTLPLRRPSPGKAQFKFENLNRDRIDITIPLSEIGITNEDGTGLFCIIHVDLADNNTIDDEYSNLDNSGESAYVANQTEPQFYENGAWYFINFFKILKVEEETGNQPPSAEFSKMYFEPSHVPCTVVFDASDSTDADGDSLTYEWDFGDGENSTGVTTIHTYLQDNSTFTVALTVSDGNGGVDTVTDWISTLGPLLYFWYEDADNDGWGNSEICIETESPIQPFGYVGEDKTDDGNDTDPYTFPGASDVGIVNGVDYGDGMDNDYDGLIDEDDHFGPPVARFEVSPYPQIVNDFCTFDAHSSYHTNPRDLIVRYEWDFDMNTKDPLYFKVDSIGATVSYRYPEVGTYIVGLRIIDSLGMVDYAYSEVVVLAL